MKGNFQIKIADFSVELEIEEKTEISLNLGNFEINISGDLNESDMEKIAVAILGPTIKSIIDFYNEKGEKC